MLTLEGDLGIGGGPPGLRVWLDASLPLSKMRENRIRKRNKQAGQQKVSGEPSQRRQRERMFAKVRSGSRQKLVRGHALQVGAQVLQEVACKKSELLFCITPPVLHFPS